MACKSCHWLVTVLECCGLKRQEKISEDTKKEVTYEEEVIGDSPKVQHKTDAVNITEPAEVYHSAYVVASVSCPDIADGIPQARNPNDDHRGSKHPSAKARPHPEPHILHPRLSSDSQIRSHFRTPPTAASIPSPPAFNAHVGDGNYSSPIQNQGDVESDFGSSVVLENELTNQERVAEKVGEQGENQMNAGESVLPLPKELKPSDNPKNDNGVDDLARFTSPANRTRKRTNATIIVYHVTVADRNRDLINGFKPEDSEDVEMVDLSNQSEDVEMADLTTDGFRLGGPHPEGAAHQSGTQNLEVVATIEHGSEVPGGSFALKSGDFSSSINIVASMRYIPRCRSGGLRSYSESNVCMGSEDARSVDSKEEAIVVIEDPGLKRTILWNEAVKVIYFDVTSKLRKSASSSEGQQDMLAWETVPLKDAPRGSRSKWAKAVRSGFIRSDFGSFKPSGRLCQSDKNLRRSESDEDDTCGSTSSVSSSTSTFSEEN